MYFYPSVDFSTFTQEDIKDLFNIEIFNNREIKEEPISEAADPNKLTMRLHEKKYLNCEFCSGGAHQFNCNFEFQEEGKLTLEVFLKASEWKEGIYFICSIR